MMKKIILFAILGFLVQSCKSKKNISKRSERNVKEMIANKEDGNSQVQKTTTSKIPVATGEFIQFEINSVESYIQFFAETAQREMVAYGIPASITLAQGLLESGLGKGQLAMRTNNHFGIKCHTGWTGDSVLHDDDEKNECFRKYNHPMYSYRDHSLFLTTRSRYASLFELDRDDYKGWARGLQKAGYATDKKYPQKLISLIERYRLDQYDDVRNSTFSESNNVFATTGNTSGNGIISAETPARRERGSLKPVTYVVLKGDTLWAISRKYGVAVSRIRELNNMDNNHLFIGQVLVIKKN